MNVIILTEASEECGYGHLTRCIAFYQALKDEGFSPHIIVNGDQTVESIVSGYDHTIGDWLKEESLWNMLDPASMILIDSYLAELKVYQKISDRTFLSIYMDDHNRLSYPKGMIVNGAVFAPELNYQQDQGHTYLLGEKYALVRKEFLEVPKKEINTTVKKILVTLGERQVPDWVQLIKEILTQQFSFQFDFIDPAEGRISADKMKNLMLDADICISAGGQTTYELARVGVPTIGICPGENQRLNLEKWHQMGFIEYVGRLDDQNLKENLIASIQKFLPFEERLKRNKIGVSTIDGKGAHRIACALKENLEGVKS